MADSETNQSDDKLNCPEGFVVLNVGSHSSEVVRQMNDLRNHQLLFDVAISDGQLREIHAHKIVLAASFPYFKVCFSQPTKDGNKTVYILERFNWEAVESMIDFAYTGQTLVSVDKVQDVLDLASFLGSESVVRECCKVIVAQIDFCNVFDILALGATPGLSDLMIGARDFIVPRFDEIMNSPEVLNLPVESLATVLGADGISLHRDKIILDPEDQELALCEILYNWIQSDPVARLLTAIDIAVPKIRWSFISSSNIEHFRLRMAKLASSCDSTDNELLSCKRLLEKFGAALNARHLPRYGGRISYIFLTRNLCILMKCSVQLTYVVFLPTGVIVGETHVHHHFGEQNYFPYHLVRQNHITNPLVPFNDSDLPKPTYVQGMRVYVRLWDGRRIVGGLSLCLQSVIYMIMYLGLLRISFLHTQMPQLS